MNLTMVLFDLDQDHLYQSNQTSLVDTFGLNHITNSKSPDRGAIGVKMGGIACWSTETRRDRHFLKVSHKKFSSAVLLTSPQIVSEECHEA